MSKFNFELAILRMNAMYKLPIAKVPSTGAEVDWQRKHFPAQVQGLNEETVIIKRLQDFFGAPTSILADELKEHKELIDILEDTPLNGKDMVDFLVGLADLLGDIQVYCASEMARFGIPNQDVLEIIMSSNESKLGADGKPIYNEQGKFMKGPNYWKPEPKIRELIVSLRGEGKEDEHQS